MAKNFFVAFLGTVSRDNLEKFKSRTQLPWLFKRLPFSPNAWTFFSLVAGVLAFYFLFVHHVWFVVCCLLHLLFDYFDGGVARYRGLSTTFGEWFDFSVDRLVQVLFLFKISFFYPWMFIVLGLFVLHNLVYVVWRKPLYYSRSVTVVAFCLQLYLVGVLWTLAMSVYGFFRQLR